MGEFIWVCEWSQQLDRTGQSRGVAESADFRESAPSSAETRKHGGIRKVRSSEFLHTTSGFLENGQKPWIPVWESASHIFAPFAYFNLFSSCGGHLHSNRTSFILPYFHEKEILEYKTNAFWYVCIIIKLLRFNKWIIP